MSNTRVRFAPSPTGHVHIGNIRAAIFNWLFARHEGGVFLLRLEDTDRERSTPEAVQTVMDALDWLGLNYDEPPVYQSERRDAHLAAAESLLSSGLAYKEDKGGTGKGECVVFKMPGEDIGFHDEIKGDLEKKADDMKDFVIVRSDGSPIFHLANVLDDIEMGITHIIRGDDHIENTYRQVALYRALGADVPKYAHLPMIVNQHGKPYSKRDGSAYVGEFKEQGFLPEALLNYLALLGWSPGDDREKMSRKEMAELFDLSRVKSGPAQLDTKKLTHMNADYIADMPLSEFLERITVLPATEPWQADEGHFREVAALMQSRTHLFSYAEGWKYFFSDDLEYEEKPVRKGLKKPGIKEALALLVDRLDSTEFTTEALEQAIHDVESAKDIKQGKLNYPVRVAVSGTATGAGIYETLVLLGKERVIKRIGYASENLCE